MTEDTTIGVDLAKNVFEVAISHTPGTIAMRRRLKRARFGAFFAEQKPAIVVMEACGSAHYWGREFEKMGHEVILLPPHQVRPYVTRNKTDRCDAAALLEAHRNESILPVPVKCVEAQSILALHRARSGWMQRRTGLLNMTRGFLREYGIFVPVGARQIRLKMEALREEPPQGMPDALRSLLVLVRDELGVLESSIADVDELIRTTPQDPAVKRIMTIPGIGILGASALVATVRDIRRFPSGRRLASYFGLTPREISSGEHRRLGRINKQGNTYVRTLLTHGARAALRFAIKGDAPVDRHREWARSIAERRGYRVATVALANKNARLAWAAWRTGKTFDELVCANA